MLALRCNDERGEGEDGAYEGRTSGDARPEQRLN
jgi:hypothetical protein